MESELILRDNLIEVCRRIYSHGFVAAYDGNLSIKLSEDLILTTPSGVSKGFLVQDDIIVVNNCGKKISGLKNPSSEIRMHIMVYQKRPDVAAVIHAHPPYSTALTLAGVSLEDPILPEVVLSMEKIPTVKYATPTTEEVPESIKDLIPYYDALLLERHGTLTVGKTLDEAYFKLEKIEHCAKTIFAAKQMGNITPLDDKQVEKLIQIRTRLLNS